MSGCFKEFGSAIDSESFPDLKPISGSFPEPNSGLRGKFVGSFYKWRILLVYKC